MATIYAFKNFNNYYNRKVKGQSFNTIEDFCAEYGGYDYIQSGTFDNFSKGNGVTMSHVLGKKENPYSGDCSYILYCKDDNNITSRWFIIDHNFIRNGQYTLSLYRDTIAENWDKIVNSNVMIERAIVSDDSPFIYNKENITTNQIKQNEYLLKDESECGWLVGYINRNYEANGDDTGIIDITVNTVPDYEVASLSDAETAIGASANTSYKKYDYDNFKYEMKIEHNPAGIIVTYKYEGGTWTKTTMVDYGYTDFKTTQTIDQVLTYLNSNVLYTVLNGALNTQFPPNNTQYNNIYNNQNKIVYVNTGADIGYYKVDTTDSIYSHPTYYNITNTTALENLNTALSGITHTGEIKSLIATGIEKLAFYKFTPTAFGTYYVDFSDKTKRLHCKEAFDMFCIPYKDTYIRNSASSDPIWSTAFKQSKDGALSIAQGIAQALGSNIYDLQLLPYCPMTGIQFVSDTIIDINDSDSKRYAIVYGNNQSTNPKAIVIWCTSNKGSFVIDKQFTMYNKKMQNECELYRLSSPNYNGQFDFNIAKNNGVAQFKVDYTYLPIQPYIHVVPIFNSSGIYSNGDFNDAKGLICGGDFSLSYLSDKWVEYKNQNKNYNNIFDRETQNLEYNYKKEMTQAGVASITGALSAGGTGAMIGSAFGPAGMAVGGLVGGLASLGGAAGDMVIQRDLHNEAMDYREDVFNMQLENIQALPLSLTKITAINNNNKIWPFIEEYDCTEEERVAIAKNIAFNSMTLGIVDKPVNYINNSWSYEDISDKGFIKGQIIRLEGIEDDTHILNTIASEFNKGVYTK